MWEGGGVGGWEAFCGIILAFLGGGVRGMGKDGWVFWSSGTASRVAYCLTTQTGKWLLGIKALIIALFTSCLTIEVLIPHRDPADHRNFTSTIYI